MIVKEEIRWKGRPVLIDAVLAGNRTFIVSKGFIKTATLKNEWQEDVDNPDEVIRSLKKAATKIDLLRFWQRVPESKPRYSYYQESCDVAAIPISTFKQWWEKQISPKVRNKIRKSQKLGVVVRQVALDDDLIRGIMGVFNDSPVRRGKRFWHYGRDFDSVKRGMWTDNDNSIFVGAFHENELIGFIKFFVTDRYAVTSLILDKQSHRDKAPMNAMIAKVVEICAERQVPHFTYTVWRRGDHGHFQESNGFIKIPVPEYFVPLTLKGKVALHLGLHRGLKGAVPERVMVWLLGLRSAWYVFKYRPQLSDVASSKSATASSA